MRRSRSFLIEPNDFSTRKTQDTTLHGHRHGHDVIIKAENDSCCVSLPNLNPWSLNSPGWEEKRNLKLKHENWNEVFDFFIERILPEECQSGSSVKRAT